MFSTGITHWFSKLFPSILCLKNIRKSSNCPVGGDSKQESSAALPHSCTRDNSCDGEHVEESLLEENMFWSCAFVTIAECMRGILVIVTAHWLFYKSGPIHCIQELTSGQQVYFKQVRLLTNTGREKKNTACEQQSVRCTFRFSVLCVCVCLY